MHITIRNLMRLLCAGVFKEELAVEPMSAWKWRQAYKLSLLHGVGNLCWQGIERLRGQFFLQLPDDLMQQWQQATPPRVSAKPESKKLRRIGEELEFTTPTYRLLQYQYQVAHHILNDGLLLHDLVLMGYYIREHNDEIDYQQLHDWDRSVGLSRIIELENLLLTELLGFTPEELLPQETATDRRLLNYIVNDLGDLQRPRSTQWYFAQGNDIFVHASNSSAMLWQARRSMHYFRYCPAESVTNILTSFARSLSQIEE